MKSKQVLDMHQMQHLQELGLKLNYDTLYRYVKFEDTDWLLKPFSDLNIIGISFKYIPAYILQDVLDALPASIKHKDFKYYLVYNKSEGFIGYYRVDFDGNHRYAQYEEFYNGIDGLSVIDAAYELLVWCIENKFVETDKTNEV